MDVISKLWEQEIERWNGKQNFIAHWENLQSNKDQIRYCCVDIINDITKLKKLLTLLTPDTFLWTSNCWTTTQTFAHANYNFNLVHSNFQKWCTELTKNVYLFGNIRFPHKTDDDCIIEKAGNIITPDWYDT